jgi:inorganic pyrophosphatase
MSYSTRQVGAKFSNDYRLYFEDAEGKVVSPFHDIPLHPDPSNRDVFNMVCEIPRFSNAKLEISKEEHMNPIKQDVKKGKLRFVKNLFPYHGYIWNYGAFPQTWESPLEVDHDTGCAGDNDPLDVIEIGGAVMGTGSVHPVKVLGVIALLDEGETDWKVIAISVNDPLAAQLHDIGDVEAHCPGLLEATRDWFRNYKIPDGKPANEFAFGGVAKDRAYALKVIAATAASWGELIEGRIPAKCDKYDVSVASRSVGAAKIASEEGIPAKTAKLPDIPLDSSVDSWAFVPRP